MPAPSPGVTGAEDWRPHLGTDAERPATTLPTSCSSSPASPATRATRSASRP
ncbi:hypothetical protein NKG05_06710 [Oerskovia sp. M15]